MSKIKPNVGKKGRKSYYFDRIKNYVYFQIKGHHPKLVLYYVIHLIFFIKQKKKRK